MIELDKKKWITYSFTESLIENAKKNKKIIVLDADLSDDLNLNKFSKNFLKDLFKMELLNKIWFLWRAVWH